MKVIKAYPPNFSVLAKRFPIKGKPGILYAWGDTLYNPSGVKVTPWIMSHEEVHGGRQKRSGLDAWWDNYMKIPGYRLYEELLAHQAEWQAFLRYSNEPSSPYLDLIATRLSSPLYGSMVAYEDARLAIKASGSIPDAILKKICGADRYCDTCEERCQW